MQFTNKIVWIAGASSGIGESLVYAFISEGATVIASAPFIDQLNQVKENCGDKKDFCEVLSLDMLQPGNFPELAEKVIQEFKRIDILIHVAGISQRALVQETEMETVRKIMEINFFGAVALTKAVLPVMLEQGAGQIAAVSSIVGKFGFPLRSIYSASKHALHGFFESLQAENLKNNIHVTMIIPGRVKTEISLNAVTGDGKAWGKNDPGQEGGISTKKASKIILKGLFRKKKEVLVGGKELTLVYVKRFLPGLFWKMVNKVKST
jgi:short-subunit dehydrogenase